jgi:hypothetical protein
MVSINWLHLTDLHIGYEKTRQATIQDLFFEDLEVMSATLGPFDLVLFTGDLVYKGVPEEFEEADKFVQRLLDTLEKSGSGRPVFLAVPGNHDLLRPNVVHIRELIKWKADLQRDFWYNDASPHRKAVMDAFQNYEAWWSTHRNSYTDKYSLKTGLLPGDFCCTFEKEGATVGIVGLNTTFLQLTDDETFREVTGHECEGRLAISARQYHSLGGREWAKRHHLCLLLTHQPLTWLTEDCRKEFNQDIFDPDIFAAHLFGHMHAARYWGMTQGGGRQRRSFQGKSLFGMEHFLRIVDGGQKGEMDRMHGYAFGKIEFSGDVASLRIWPRRAWEPGDTWRFGPDYESYELAGDLKGHYTEVERLNLRMAVVQRQAPPAGVAAARDGELQLTLTVKQDRTVRVEEAPEVQGRVELSDPVLEAVGLFREWLVQKRIEPYGQQVMGKLLFRALFNGQVRTLFEETLARVRKPGRLRLHLNFGDARNLAGLPWEYMYYTRENMPSGYLSSDVDMCLSRLCLAEPALAPVGKPLTIVAVVPKLDPRSVKRTEHAFNETPVLNMLKEQPQFKLIPCEPPTRTGYVEQLEALADEYLLHFIGYGRLEGGREKEGDKKLQVGFLPEENKQDNWNWMSEDEFVQVFQKRETRIPHLVFLQLYDSPAQQVASLAQKLITAGVPFVVATQHQISDAAAARFAARFYQDLAEGQAVGVAVQEGRIEIATKTSSVDVGTPVIYLSTDSPLLPPPPPLSPTKEKPGRTYPPGQSPTPSGEPEVERRPQASRTTTPVDQPEEKKPSLTTPEQPGGPVGGTTSVFDLRGSTETPLKLIAEVRKAGWRKAREFRVETQVQKAFAEIDFRAGVATIREFLDRGVVSGDPELIEVYEAMLKVLEQNEDENP